MQSPDLLTYNFQEKYSFQEQNLPQIIPREGIVKVSGRRENCDKIKFKTACSNLQTPEQVGEIVSVANVPCFSSRVFDASALLLSSLIVQLGKPSL